jgi:serine/threonine-protein kinase HipA
LTPVYDLVNTTIVLVEPEEEFALELNGKKHGITKKDLIDYFGPEHCYVQKEKAVKILDSYLKKIPIFETWIQKSFLSKEMKEKYLKLLLKRAAILNK